MTGKPYKVEVRSPRAGEFFRVKPDLDARKEVYLTRDDDGVLYLIAPSMVSKMKKLRPDRVEHSMMFLVCNYNMENFFWPIKIPVPSDHVVYRAMKEWVCFELLQ